jgi:hypothetical protein
MGTMKKMGVTPELLLAVGLAFVFAYAAISSFQQPAEWVGYVPTILTKFVSADTAVRSIAVYELLLAGWLLTGKYRKYAAALSALTLAGIVVFNWSQMLITFRDIGLLFMALALFWSS